MRTISAVLLLFLCSSGLLRFGFCDTYQQDIVVLRSISSSWQGTPPSWGQTNDPCGTPWDGVFCTNSRVTSLKLSTMGIKGTLSTDIGQLTELQALDLSYNKDLGGTLTSSIRNLRKLTTLILQFCSFNGSIPEELSSLTNLSYLALNSNQFSGKIPASLGLLSNLYWLDLAENQLTGTLPISSSSSPGLDMLHGTKHFHFNKNQLSGEIAEQLFSPQMTLLHILFDGNQFSGPIPSSIGLVKTLEVLRLDRNLLSDTVPSSIGNLSNLHELSLANNKLSGPLPDLSKITNLNYVDLSNNTFTASDAPSWFSTLASLTTIVIDNGGLIGTVPKELFGLPQLQQVIMPNNQFNGTLDLSNISASTALQLINFQNNSISVVKQTSSYTSSLILAGNPACAASTKDYCRLQQSPNQAYSTSLANCVYQQICKQDQHRDPGSCSCAVPYQGLMTFRAPFFGDVSDSKRFQDLETSLWEKLGLKNGSVYISNVLFNQDNYLLLNLALFPSDGIYFDRSEILRLGFALSNQTYKPPHDFGPFFFSAFQYPFPESGGKSSMSTAAIAGIAVVCIALVVGLVALAIYALRQKRKAKEATEQANPFASWGAGSSDAGSAPQLKGARYFNFDEIRKCTNNFSESNEIGSGGYGKVYRGTISTGQMVAIKRAQQGSMQGGLEFKTEIELLSRVHHKNVVELVGFCFEQGEQMLVYEYVPNGTLRNNLIGSGGRQLDWKRRLRIALGSARGLAYLHELANPPIIHRDVKTSNILLDEYLNAKVADFGLSKLLLDSQKGHVSTQVKGTLGYLDPEYYMTQQLSEKSDVYSFGVVMLELITSRLPIEKGKYIVRQVRTAIDRHDEEYYGLGDVIDPVIKEYYGLGDVIDPVIKDVSTLIGFRRFVDLALQCLNGSAASRPIMSEVVKEIELLLQSDGVSTSSNPNSAFSSATDFGNTKKNPRHPYQDQPARKDDNNNSSSSAFEYSGGFKYSGNIEPK